MGNIKIFDISEESLAKLGLALRNNNCRKIMVLLSTKEMYVNQIASELKIGVNIVSDQVKILKELGLLKIRRKPIVRKGNNHNYYTLKTDIFISTFPEENKLKRIFKDGLKFTSIGIAAIVTWFISGIYFKPNLYSKPDSFDFGETLDVPIYQESTFFPFLIIIIGLLINTIFLYKKKEKLSH